MTLALLKTKWKHLFVVLMILGMAFPVNAQNNPQSINNRLYPLYIKAFNMRKQAECLPIADSLYRAAVAIGDRYGECYALQVKFLHEFHKPNNYTKFDHCLQEYLDKVHMYNFDRFYIYAVSMKASYFIREKKYLEAFIYLQEEKKHAEYHNDARAICMLQRMTGVIQHFRGELSQAIASYRNTIELYKKHNLPRV